MEISTARQSREIDRLPVYVHNDVQGDSKGMTAFSLGLRELGELDSLSRLESPMHRADPRAKLLVTFLFLTAVVSINRYEIVDLLPFAAFPLLTCVVGQVPFSFIARKLLFTAPFILIFGAFNPIFDTAPIQVLGGIALSGGWISYMSIVIKFQLTVAAAFALIAVTGMNPLCGAALRIGVPKLFVTQLALLYRYLFVLSAEAQRMQRAAALRSPGRNGMSLSLFGSLVGHLLLRTLDRAQRIYLAMRCRGFDDRFPLLCPMKIRRSDGLFVIGWTSFFVAVRFLHLPDLIGRVVLLAISSVNS
jgi:cobalt/nickel transport system permease protein